MKKIRADKLLANLGYGSRKDVTLSIKAGRFIVNGAPVTDPSATLNSGDLDGATYRGEPLDPLSPLTLILHKPRTYTCSHDEHGLLIYDLLPERWSRRSPPLSSAGRLDKDSTGLVMITDDGDLLHRVISPKLHVWKKYRVVLRDALKGTEADIFASGTFTFANDKTPLKPARWTPDGEKSGVMELQEGRYHQIRRMFAALGNHVEELHRFQIGGLELGNLPEGEFRLLDADEVARIFA